MATDTSGSGKRVLRVGALSRLGTLDPRNANDTISSMILGEIFETPYDPPYGSEAPTPLLFAEPLKPETARDRSSYSAAVRPGVVFSDGTPLTAELAARALNSSPDFKLQASAEAKGDRVLFRLLNPNSRFELALTTISSSLFLEKGGTLLGTGPFMFPQQSTLAQLQRLDKLTLVRNPLFRSPVSIDEIEFSIYPASSGGGTEMLLEAAKRGEIDFTYSLTSVDANALKGFPMVPSISTGNATGLLHFNCSRAPFNDPAVRNAVAHALDRRKIAESTYERNPLAYVASSLLPPLMGRDKHTFTFDLIKAKALSAAAGSKMPKRISLMVLWSPRPYIPNPKRAGELITEQLAELGIGVDILTPRDRNDYFDHVRKGNYDAALGGWIADTADISDYLEALLASRSIPSPTNNTATTNNSSRYASPAMDALLAKLRADPTDDARAEVMKLLVEDAPLVPLIYGQAVAVYSRSVRGFKASPLGRCSLASLQLS